jgi:ribosomal protein L16 Arg81 hydroxylase
MTLDRRTGRIPTVESSASWSIRRPSLDLDGREYILGECMAMSFECLIDPISPSMFFAEFYEQKPLLIDRRQTSKWASLLSIDEIDLYLSTTTPCRPDVFLVDTVRDLKPDDYSFPDSEPPGRIDLPRAYQLFAAGATISLSQMHERVEPLARLCRAIEKTFSSHSQTNIYLSPPNAQGFKTHFDTHDVFVLQVSGSKQWALYDTEIVLPLRGQAFDPDKHTPGLPTREFTLHVGDLFYCPRGLYHSARSTDETSLHITLGLIGKTWADVMIEAVSAACLSSPAFRANLPVGFANAGYDSDQAAATFRALLDAVAREAQLAPILQRLAENFVTSRRPALDGCLQELEAKLSLETEVTPRSDLIYLLREADEKLVVMFGATEISFPGFVKDALSFALEDGPFAVRDLPQLDDEGKLVLVRRLLKEGLLVRDKASAWSVAN